jgi:hypothetical protein
VYIYIFFILLRDGWWQVGRAHVYFVALIGHVNVGDDAPRVRQKLKQ